MTILDAPAIDYPRDQWGHPLIIPVGGGKPVPYIRASSAAKTVEDTYNLEMYARRNVAYGMAHDASLVARVLAIGGTPSTWDMDAKRAVNKVHEDAATVALAHKAADIGTALHRLTERVDRGEQVVAGLYEPDVEAYINCLIIGGLTVEYVECRMVCDALLMAGTADRIVERAGRHYILDLKTGGTVEYGGLGWAAQLAAYAHGLLYDIDAGQRVDTPPLDRTTGYICHLPAGEGRCTLYEIDLVAGYRAAELANEIRDVRRQAKRWISLLPVDAPAAEAPVVLPDRRGSLLARYRALPAEGQAVFRARGVDPSDLDAVEVALDGIEQGPVSGGTPSPPDTGPTTGELHVQLGRGHDEGDTLAAVEAELLRERFNRLPADMQFWLGAIGGEANRAGVSFYITQRQTQRRYWINAGLIILAEAGISDSDMVRALAARATGRDAPLFPSVSVGHGVGAMDAVDAGAFYDGCADLADARLHVDCSSGHLRLV